MDHNDMRIAEYGRVTPQAIGRRLAALREDLGMSQEQCGDAVGLSESVLGHRERGRSPLSAAEAWLIETRLGLPARFILFGDPSALPPERWASVRARLLAPPEPPPGSPRRKGRPPKTPRAAHTD